MRSNVTPGRILTRLTFLTSLLVMVLTQAFAADTPLPEPVHKAKIVKKIVQMVEWPANTPKNPFTICISGQTEGMDELKKLDAEKISGRTLKVKTIEKLSDGQNNACQLIYMTNQPEATQAELIKMYTNKPVLLLGDMDSFALHGGSMNFTRLNGVLAVTVNTESMKNARLKLDLKSVDQITVIPEAKDLLNLK